ncbi:MAG: hypothetical protein RR296_08790 [Clostridia bacterium]
MENEPDAELDGELGFSKYDCRNKGTDNSRNGHGGKTLRTSFGDVGCCEPASATWTYRMPLPGAGQEIPQDIVLLAGEFGESQRLL